MCCSICGTYVLARAPSPSSLTWFATAESALGKPFLVSSNHFWVSLACLWHIVLLWRVCGVGRGVSMACSALISSARCGLFFFFEICGGSGCDCTQKHCLLKATDANANFQLAHSGLAHFLERPSAACPRSAIDVVKSARNSPGLAAGSVHTQRLCARFSCRSSLAPHCMQGLCSVESCAND